MINLEQNSKMYRKILSQLPISAAITLWMISASPILRSSWSGDDWPNSQTPYWLSWRYGSADFFNTIQEALYWNRAWMFGQGRFYPFSWIESRIQFVYLRDLGDYKLFQFSTLVVCGLLFAYLVYVLSRSKSLAITTLSLLALTIQIRRDFDPHLAFASMVPLMLIKTFVSCILAYRIPGSQKKSGKFLLSLGSAILLFMAMSTYEFAFVLFPLVLISFISGFDHHYGRLGKLSFPKLIDRIFTKLFDKDFKFILVAWISYGILVFGILRNIAKDISGAYVLGVSPSSLKVFITQLTSGLPLISFQVQDFAIEISNGKFGIFTFILIMISIMIYQISKTLSVRRDLEKLKSLDNSRTTQYLIFFSVILITTPGIIMSFQQTWWDLAGFQKSYLGVMITEFGTALLIGVVCLRGLSPKIKRG